MALRESAAVKQVTRRAGDLGVPEDYIVLEQNPDGTVLLGPDTSWEAMKRRLGGEDVSQKEFDRVFGDLPSDDEG